MKHHIMVLVVFREKIPDVMLIMLLMLQVTSCQNFRTGRKYRKILCSFGPCIFVNFDYKEMRTSKRVMHFGESFVLNLDLENKYYRSRLYKMHSFKAWSILIRKNDSIIILIKVLIF